MAKRNLLEADPTILETKLRMIDNVLEEDKLLNNVLNGNLEDIFNADSKMSSLTYRVVQPEPGICVKTFKLYEQNNEKVFINICQSDGIPPPEPITSGQLIEMLQTETETSYRVPMSISELRQLKQKDAEFTLCDVAIHPLFFQKIQDEELFRDFLIQIIIEAFDTKYNVKLDGGRCRILKPKQKGTLVKHRVQNRDLRHVYDSYKDKEAMNVKTKIQELDNNESGGGGKKKLIEEIEINGNGSGSGGGVLINNNNNNNNNITKQNQKIIKETTALAPPEPINKTKQYDTTTAFMNNNKIKIVNGLAENQLIEWRLVLSHDRCTMLAEFYLPKVTSAEDIQLDLGEDQLLIQSFKHEYYIDRYIDCIIDQEKTTAEFNTDNRVFTVTMPILLL